MRGGGNTLRWDMNIFKYIEMQKQMMKMEKLRQKCELARKEAILQMEKCNKQIELLKKSEEEWNSWPLNSSQNF